MRFNKIMMCKPTYFDVIHYRLNAHMNMSRHVNLSLAQFQWDSLYKGLINMGVSVDLIEPVPSLVDMVFTANSAITYKDKAVISNFNAVPRKGESKYYDVFYKDYGYKTHMITTEFEGAGDALFSHNKTHLWIANGFRSDKEAVYEIKDFLTSNTINYHTLQLKSNLYYHLDTCFCPVDDKVLILYEEAFDTESLKKIYNVYNENDCIKVSLKDAANFACNSIVVTNELNNTCIVGNYFSNELKDTYKKNGYDYLENNMSEFLLSGGSTKCSVIDIEMR